MITSDKASGAMTDLEFHASGFVAKVGGTWTDSALERFRDYLKKIGIPTPVKELRAVVESAKEKFWQGDCRIFVCNALPCCTKIGFDLSNEAIDRSHAEFGIPVSFTGCQGPCKQAPVLTARNTLLKCRRPRIGKECSGSQTKPPPREPCS
jgi:hypothetical protein